MTLVSSSTEQTFTFSSDSQVVVVAKGVLIDTGSYNAISDTKYYNNVIYNMGYVFGWNAVEAEYNSIAMSLSNAAGAILAGTVTGVRISGAYDTVTNAGTIQGQFGVSAEGSDHLAVINSGTIEGSSAGIDLEESKDFHLINSSVITGATVGLNISLAGNSNSFVTNSGRVTGGSEAIAVIGDGSGRLTLHNTGTLDGTVILSNQQTILYNSGKLDGDLQLGTGQDVVRNFGDINGDISLSGGRDTVVNNGSIRGSVILGDGGSVFNGRGGTVNGLITGGSGADKLIAGNDGETLAGGGGHDTMVGGTGDDTFAFSSFQPADSDIIHMFNVVEDTIQLDHATFTKLAPDKMPVFAVGTAATSTSNYLFYNSATGGLYYDSDGSGTADPAMLVATLDTGLKLTAHDFTVV